jgi:hypothetical protein
MLDESIVHMAPFLVEQSGLYPRGGAAKDVNASVGKRVPSMIGVHR